MQIPRFARDDREGGRAGRDDNKKDYNAGMNEARPKNPNERPAEAVQDDFLNRLRREQTPVTVLLVDGTRLAGRIKSFDRFSILLESQGQEQLLCKHAIASVAPGKPPAT